MRQTSQAVLLLLGAAAVSAITQDFAKSTQATATAPTIATQGRADLSKQLNPVYQSDYTLVVVTVAAATDDTKASAAGGTSCVDCIRGKITSTNEQTVWCSAGWNYEYTTLGIADSYPVQTTSASTWDVAGAAAAGATATAGDQGYCCYEAGVFNTEVVKTPTGATFDTQKLNKWTCPAKFTGSWTTNGTYAANTGTELKHATTNWWCSDGTYNLATVSDDTYATNGATASSNIKDTAAFASGIVGTKVLSKDQTAIDKRLDLFLAACRQKRTMCGEGHVPETGTLTRTISTATGSFGSGEKCTWVMRSKTKAPTFSITNTTASKQISNKYDIIYSEWVEGWQLAKGVDYLTGYKTDEATAYTQGGIVIPGLSSTNYQKAYKHNYGNSGAWATANVQVPGEAFTYQRNSAACATDATDLNANANAPANCWNTEMQKRWFSLDPSGARFQNAEADQYATLLTTFTSDATKYNAYLAKVKENAEVDAFAAFFSPPEKPAVVTRPAAPTKPAAYAGMAHWPVAGQQNWRMKKGGSSNDPAPGTHYILGNNQMGGWGAWTISLLKGGYQDANTNKISHSFGLLGTTQGTALDTGRSYLKNWQKDAGFDGTVTTGARIAAQYLGTSTAEQWRATETGSVMCATADLTTATHACGWAAGATKTVANTKYVYLNVSVWSNQVETTADWVTAASTFQITFYASAWADGKDYYSPAAAATAPTLSTPAAAQALAASAAAVVAVAAALY